MAENAMAGWGLGDQGRDWLRSLARAPATIAGAPVDSVNALIGMLNALGGGKSPLQATQKPVMGSQWLAERLGMPEQRLSRVAVR